MEQLIRFFSRIDLSEITPETAKVLSDVIDKVLDEIEVKDGYIVWGDDKFEIPKKEDLGKLYHLLGEKRAKTVSKAIVGFPEWAYLFEKEINEGPLSEEYKKAAKDWEGDIALHIPPISELGLDTDLYIYMGLDHGKIRPNSLMPVSKEDAEKAAFMITGTYDQWMSVMKGELGIIKALMRGEMTLKGDLKKLMKETKAARLLIDIVQKIPSMTPDDFSDEMFALAKTFLKKLSSKLNPKSE